MYLYFWCQRVTVLHGSACVFGTYGGMWLLLIMSCLVVKKLEQKLVNLLLCACQAAKEDLVQQGWKGLYLGGNYVSGTCPSLCCCTFTTASYVFKATTKSCFKALAKPFKASVQHVLHICCRLEQN